MSALYDKNRREIRQGDVIKVFHFIGARRKRHYMYKHSLGAVPLGETQEPCMRFDHLEMKGTGYYELMDGRVLEDYEIVQGIEAHWETDRPRKDPRP